MSKSTLYNFCNLHSFIDFDEGVDGVFIGPADLAVDSGYAPSADAPAIKKLIVDAIKRISSSGKASGVLTLDKSFIAECQKAGATIVAVGIDVLVYAQGIRSLANE